MLPIDLSFIRDSDAALTFFIFSFLYVLISGYPYHKLLFLLFYLTRAFKGNRFISFQDDNYIIWNLSYLIFPILLS